VDAPDFRRVMSFWATGVSVVTAEGDEGPAGATANALSSLSLDPPLVLVCFDLSSRTLGAVRESQRFCINVLADGQEEVARMFATKKSQEEKFAAIRHRSIRGAPVIDDCLGFLVCSLDSELGRGDHVIAIGEVLDARVDEDVLPLLFYRSDYLRLPQNDPVAEAS
jgi:flavin reductase (DIM6/NTAB) family NADH-FMN oxidoreductase RutF